MSCGVQRAARAACACKQQQLMLCHRGMRCSNHSSWLPRHWSFELQKNPAVLTCVAAAGAVVVDAAHFASHVGDHAGRLTAQQAAPGRGERGRGVKNHRCIANA